MKLIPRDSRHGISIFRLALTLTIAALIPLLAYATAPAWWSQRGVLVQNGTADDYALVNQGQLKNIARAAVAEMDAGLPGGAGDALHNLVQAWASPTAQTNDYAPVNLGQLKNVAKPFYDRLIAAGVTGSYPWSGSSTQPDDFAVANIGQVKNLFSFDFSGTVIDSDGNGLPDAWEQQNFGHLGVDPNDDPDGDGATNLREYQRDTDPNHYDAASSLVLSPDQLTVVVSPGETRTAMLTISNAGSGPLTFQLTPRDNTFPALSSTDSDQQSGPVYEWEDISTTGTLLPSVSDADDGFESFDLGFAFPYFDQSFTSVFVSSNGFITFGEGSDQYDNYALPGTDMPANEIAAFHTDLNPGASGDIYYLNEADRTIIQYENVARYNGTGNVTFQIVLKNDGAIEIRYKDLPTMVNDVTVGLQNATRDQGLTVAYGQDYLHPNLAVRISQNVDWFRVAPASGTLAESETEQSTVTFDARGLGGGTYSGTLQVTWTGGGFFLMPVTLRVDNAPSIVAITAPGEGFNQWENKSIAFNATATDPDTQIVRVEFYEGETPLGTGTSSGGNEFAFTWSAVPVGPHIVTARAIDQFGQASNSLPVTVIGKPDLDADGDGLTGSEEEMAGTDPNAVDTDGDGLTDGEEVNQLGTNPLSRDSNDNGVEDGNEDTDGDGLSNTAELRTYHTDPNRWDSDYDGSSDGDEVAAGSYPDDASSYPPRIREVSRGLGYYYTDSGWNEQLYGRLNWSASWSSALGGGEEWSGPRVPLTQLSGKLAGKVTFPNTVERSPNYSYYTAIQNTYSWVLPEYTIYNAGVEHRRFWLHRFPATAKEARMTVLLSRRRQINLGENDPPWQTDHVRVETFVIPAGDTTSNAVDSTPELTQDFAPPWAAPYYSESVEETMLPAGFIKVTPSLKDEDGNDVSNSDMPKAIPETNELVEEPRAGQIPNVAYRILKAKVPERMEGETVRWSMTPQFTPEGGAQPGIRGQWPAAHPDRFEPDDAENYYLFERVSQMEGRTTIDNNGETAVRINLPPIGFNKVRVKMEFENYPDAFLEIDFEVPAIVVIDPGHGGEESDPVVAGSSWNNAKSPYGVLEKTMALDFGLSLQDALRTKANQDKLNIRIFMTRKVDENPSGAQRAHVARDNGADVIFVIHFNSDDVGDPAHGRPPHRSRGTLEVVRTTNNVVPQQDADLSDGVINRIVDALHQLGDAGANHRAQVFYDDKPAVASDLNIGNTQAYHPIRVGYCEVEFIDYGANTTDPADDEVDILLNTGPNTVAARAAIVGAMRDGIIDDLKRQPATP